MQKKNPLTHNRNELYQVLGSIVKLLVNTECDIQHKIGNLLPQNLVQWNYCGLAMMMVPF